MKKHIHYICYLIISSCFGFSAFAQKIPNIQTENLWLNNGRVDAKLTEWKLPLKAYHKDTKIWYSIANDDKNLYLAVQTTRSGGKIFAGGLTFSINTAAITFPYPKDRDRRIWKSGEVKPGSPREFEDYKEIHVVGIKSISDSLISIYNPYSIRAASTTYTKAEQKVCAYEMMIPLKLLGLSPEKNTFSYNIKLNGIILYPGPKGRYLPLPGKSKREMMEIEDDMEDFSHVSQLSGKYMLAKKP